MIIHPVTKENLLSLGMQHTCVLIGVAFLVVCVSGGWLKYLSFQGTVTAGVVGAGLVSVAIENQRKSKPIEIKAVEPTKKKAREATCDPLVRFSGTPKRSTQTFRIELWGFEGDLALQGPPSFRGGKIFFTAGNFSMTRAYINSEENLSCWCFSLGERGYVSVDGQEMAWYSWENIRLGGIKHDGKWYSSVAYDEMNQQIYAYGYVAKEWVQFDIKKNSFAPIEGLRWPDNRLDDHSVLVVDNTGNLYIFARHTRGRDTCWSLVRPGREPFLFPVSFDASRMKAINGKIYFAFGKDVYIFNSTTQMFDQIRLPSSQNSIRCFDLQGDLLVAVFEDGQGVLYNTQNQKSVDLGPMLTDRVQFCGEDTLASFGFDSVEGGKAEWLKFNKAEGSVSEGSP